MTTGFAWEGCETGVAFCVQEGKLEVHRPLNVSENRYVSRNPGILKLLIQKKQV